MLCFHLDGLLQRARDPGRMIPSVALQCHTSAWRVAFRGWFSSSVYQSLTVGRCWLHNLLIWSHREPRVACQPARREQVWCTWALSINAGIFLWHFQLCGKSCVWCIDIFFFWTKGPWTCAYCQPESPEVLAGSIFMWGGAAGFIFWCLDEHECLFPISRAKSSHVAYFAAKTCFLLLHFHWSRTHQGIFPEKRI